MTTRNGGAQALAEVVHQADYCQQHTDAQEAGELAQPTWWRVNDVAYDHHQGERDHYGRTAEVGHGLGVGLGRPRVVEQAEPKGDR